jgi:mannose-6-phosphate isomerase-like protein (cupin superfamily)
MQVVELRAQALRNNAYRDVRYTTAQMQIVFMRVPVNGEIPMETHTYSTQFITVVSGIADVRVDDENSVLQRDDSVIIPAGSRHRIQNAGTSPLKLWTIYAPPTHEPHEYERGAPNGDNHDDESESSSATTNTTTEEEE